MADMVNKMSGGQMEIRIDSANKHKAALGILDNERAVKISGAMFTMQRGAGATLARVREFYPSRASFLTALIRRTDEKVLAGHDPAVGALLERWIGDARRYGQV